MKTWSTGVDQVFFIFAANGSSKWIDARASFPHWYATPRFVGAALYCENLHDLRVSRSLRRLWMDSQERAAQDALQIRNLCSHCIRTPKHARIWRLLASMRMEISIGAIGSRSENP